MTAAIIKLTLLVVGVIICVYWIYSLVTFNYDESPCDGDCESCPFPSDGCEWKKKKGLSG